MQDGNLLRKSPVELSDFHLQDFRAHMDAKEDTLPAL